MVSFHGNCTCDRTFHYKFHGHGTWDRTFNYKCHGNGTWDRTFNYNLMIMVPVTGHLITNFNWNGTCHTTFNYTFHAEMVPMHDDCSVVSGLTSKSHFFFKVVNGLPLSITPDNTFRRRTNSCCGILKKFLYQNSLSTLGTTGYDTSKRMLHNSGSNG